MAFTAIPEIVRETVVENVLLAELTEVPPASVEVTLKLYKVPAVRPLRVTECAVASVEFNADEEP
jgi:hypothetical protein